MTQYGLATLATEAGDRAALVIDNLYFRVDRLDPTLGSAGLRSLLDDWGRFGPRLAELAESCVLPDAAGALVESPRLVAPIRFPNKLVCVGAVYSDHLQQFDLPPERWPRMPIFLRPPTTSIVGPGRTVRIPRTTRQFDWEMELAVVIGHRLADGDEAAAQAAIAGYSIGIDFTCRDLLDRGSQVGVDLVRAKAQDTMAPMGPRMVPAQFIPDPQDLGLRLTVNGEIRQDGNTSSMLFPVFEQVATISQFMTLEPADVIFTGSPAGSARSEEQYLRAGDHVCAEIERIGRLEVELYANVSEESAREPTHV